MIIVEFQPSGFGKGTYLNVGTMWLWREQSNHSFDYGYRVEGFTEFRSEKQFAPGVWSVAEQAAAEVQRHRELFPSISAVAERLLAEADDDIPLWSAFNAGVACGVAGDVRESKRFFAAVIANTPRYDYVVEAIQRAEYLAGIVSQHRVFVEEIKNTVRRERRALRLPEIADIDFSQ